jgi:hypothetical protein
MSKTLESKSIEQLMAEADELFRQINFEKHAQSLQKIKSKFLGKSGNTETSKSDSGAGGVHEAILDIVQAMPTLKRTFSTPDMLRLEEGAR